MMKNHQPVNPPTSQPYASFRRFCRVSFMTFLGLGMLGTLAVAQGDASLSGTIEVWAWPGADGPLKATIPGFNEQYPNITVNVRTVGFEDVHTKLLAALSSGTGAPDVSGLADANVIKFGNTGGLENLAERFAPYQDMIMPFKRSFVTGSNGEIWGIPWDASPTAVFYNTKLFEQYGLTPDDITTWDDYIAAGKKIVAESNGQVMMLPARPEEARFLWEMMALQQGAGLFDADMNLMIEGEAYLNACETTKRIFEAGITANAPLWEQAWYDGFNLGHWATIPHAVWMGGIIRDNAPDQAGHYTVTRFPAMSENGNYATQGFDFGSALVIPSQSQNKELAWAFVQYAQLTPEGQLSQYTQGDLFPSMTTPEVLEAPIFSEPDPYFHNDPIRQVFADSNAKFDLTIGVHPDYAEALGIVERNLAPAFEGELSCQEALANAANEVSTKLRLN